MINASGLPRSSHAEIRFDRLRLAGNIFPLEPRLVTTPAFVMTENANLLPAQAILNELDRAIKRDPWAVDLNYNRNVIRSAMERR